jgi:hypothetical protein
MVPLLGQEHDAQGASKGEAEALEVLGRVRHQLLTIPFGQSGLGKTSLLSAGLFPHLRAAGFFTVYLRLDLGTRHLTPVDQIKAALAEDLSAHGVEARLPRQDEPYGDTFTTRRPNPRAAATVSSLQYWCSISSKRVSHWDAASPRAPDYAGKVTDLGNEAVKLAPHIHRIAEWSGNEWSSLLT